MTERKHSIWEIIGAFCFALLAIIPEIAKRVRRWFKKQFGN